MKSIALVVLTLFILPLCSLAQPSIQFQGGIVSARITDSHDLVQGTDRRQEVGFVGIVFANIPLSENLSLSPGVRYIEEGQTLQWPVRYAFGIPPSVSFPSIEQTVTNTYVELPIYLKYEVLDIGTKLFALGGPALSYLLSSQTKGPYSSNPWDSRNEYRLFDFSLDIGLASQTPLSQTVALVATATYSFGLMHVYEHRPDAQSRNIAGAIGILFSLR